MTKEMLINIVEGRECRIAIMSDGTLLELYVERASSASHVGNIYKGRVTNVEPAIQAAFVDFGLNRNGFLHVSDVNPQYFSKDKRTAETVGRKRRRRDRPPIQDCLRRGQEVVVQMTKEGIGTKGPTLTTYLSIPGKLIVMMPGMSRLGVSRKIEDEKARATARQLLADLPLPRDMGFIVRTAGISSSKRDLRRDLNYLLRLWKAVEQRIKTSKAPAEIYQESDLVTRTIRDIYNTDVGRVICDSPFVARKAKEFLDVAMPRTKHAVELYTGKEGLFHEYGLEREIEKIYSRRVDLPSGGSLVIDQTEALVAIDINSGRFREHADAETTARKINLEAANEIARQLRLRDLGGVIVIDFIDMREPKNRRAVEKAMREGLTHDRARTKILRISSFCIVEMTRQRVRPSLKDSIYGRCSYCEGTGFVKSEESLALQVMRVLQRATSNDDVARIDVRVNPVVEHHLSNYQRAQIRELEVDTKKKILIHSDINLPGDAVEVTCTNHRGSTVTYDQEPAPRKESKALSTIPIEKARDREAFEKSVARDAPVTAPIEPTDAAGKTRKTHRRSRRRKKTKPTAVTKAPSSPTDARETQKAPAPVPTAKKSARRRRRKTKTNPDTASR
jgi:ribonuclease E